jgi:hypothetical protein
MMVFIYVNNSQYKEPEEIRILWKERENENRKKEDKQRKSRESFLRNWEKEQNNKHAKVGGTVG